MGAHATLSPARPERLRWLESPVRLRESFADVRGRLEAVAAQGGAEEVYGAHRRSLYRASAPALGTIAIKELRNPSPLRQLWFGGFAEHPGVREYRVGVAFEARGGRTPSFLGAALERGRMGLGRLLLFTRWLDGAVTLTRWLAARGAPPEPRLLATLAAQIAQPARLGLVHRRHSSNNLLVVEAAGEPVLYTIDFPHAQLGPGLDAAGLAGDVARIARWILLEGIWSRANVQELFEAVAAEVRDELPANADVLASMTRELDAAMLDRGARSRTDAGGS